MSVKQRLKTYLKSIKISERAFADRIGVSPGYVSSMRNSIQPDKVHNIISHFPELSAGWLMTGEGEMLKGDKQEGSERPPVIDKEERLFAMIESQQETIKELSRLVAKLEAQLESAKKDDYSQNTPSNPANVKCAAAAG